MISSTDNITLTFGTTHKSDSTMTKITDKDIHTTGDNHGDISVMRVAPVSKRRG